jgi:hypothetical protein
LIIGPPAETCLPLNEGRGGRAGALPCNAQRNPDGRGDDDRYPSFPTQREALAYMESRLRFISVFEW